MSKALINVTRVNLKDLTVAVNRLADTLDLFLLYEHQHTTQAVLERWRKQPVIPGDEPSIDYTTDKDMAVQEARDEIEAFERGDDDDR